MSCKGPDKPFFTGIYEEYIYPSQHDLLLVAQQRTVKHFPLSETLIVKLVVIQYINWDIYKECYGFPQKQSSFVGV